MEHLGTFMRLTGVLVVTGCMVLSPVVHAGLFDSLPGNITKSVTDAVSGAVTGKNSEQPPQPIATQTGVSGSPEELLKQALFGEFHVVYKGYSRRFLPVKQAVFQGQLEQAVEFYESQGKVSLAPASADWTAAEPVQLNLAGDNGITLSDKGLKFLNLLEMGSLQLDSGSSKQAIKSLQDAQKIVEKRSRKSMLGGFTEKLAGAGISVLGFGEHTPYYGEGFEKVLMLNYQSLGYLLVGDRGAYNVSRRAMDWQRQEEQRFVENVSSVNKQLNQAGGSVDFSALSKNYEPYETRAKRYASAFVNPFGWYVAGLVQEFDSYEDSSIWSNARGAYQKALDLTPDNDFIQEVVKSMEKRNGPNRDQRLLHVVVSDGFAPEKKVLASEIRLANEVIPLELPIYKPVENPAAKVVLQDARGKLLATLVEIADVESLALRYQKDTQPMRHLTVALSVLRNTAQSQMESRSAWGGAVSKMIKQFEIQSPDTRSWMSLPSRLLAARVFIKPGADSVQLVSYDKQGKELSRQKVQLNPGEHGFIYGRNIGSQLQAYRAETLWI